MLEIFGHSQISFMRCVHSRFGPNWVFQYLGIGEEYLQQKMASRFKSFLNITLSGIFYHILAAKRNHSEPSDAEQSEAITRKTINFRDTQHDQSVFQRHLMLLYAVTEAGFHCQRLAAKTTDDWNSVDGCDVNFDAFISILGVLHHLRQNNSFDERTFESTNYSLLLTWTEAKIESGDLNATITYG